MKKVTLTQDQADAIERFKTSKQHAIRRYVNRSFRKSTCLYDITLDELICALYIGYEVEPEFKVGDWVVTSDFLEPIRKVKEVNDRLLVDNTRIVWRDFGEIRHATPEEIAKEKERRWWAKHGREPWEIKEDDVLEYLGDLYIIDCFDSEKICLKSGIERKTDYEETFDFVKKHFKVVCFAEDRKDIKQ